MALDQDIFKAVAPEFAALVSPIVEPVLSLVPLAELEVKSDFWGDKTDHGVALLVAHMVAMGKKGGSGSNIGGVKKLKVGKMEKEFATVNTESIKAIESTSYGLEFVRIRRTLVKSPFFISC